MHIDEKISESSDNGSINLPKGGPNSQGQSPSKKMCETSTRQTEKNVWRSGWDIILKSLHFVARYRDLCQSKIEYNRVYSSHANRLWCVLLVYDIFINMNETLATLYNAR